MSSPYQIIGHNIEHYGVHLQLVMDSPRFVYTIGMTHYGLPELIVFGLPDHMAGGLLNHLCTQMRTGEMSCEVDKIEGVFEDPLLSCALSEEKVKGYGAQAFFWYEDAGLKPYFRQLVWASDKGFYPTDPEAPELFKRQQPFLGEAPPVAQRERNRAGDSTLEP